MKKLIAALFLCFIVLLGVFHSNGGKSAKPDKSSNEIKNVPDDMKENVENDVEASAEVETSKAVDNSETSSSPVTDDTEIDKTEAISSNNEEKAESNTSNNERAIEGNASNEATSGNNSTDAASTDSNTNESHSNQPSNDTIPPISLPILSNTKNNEQVNELILDYVCGLDSFYNEDDLSALTASHQIMFQSENYVSIYFSGTLKGGAYQSAFKSTLNINANQVSRMTLSQIVNVNEEFIKLVTSAVDEQLKAIGTDIDTVFPSGIKNELSHADSNSLSDVQSYFTSNEIGIIFSVQHAIGDYIEVRIPVSSVESYIL